MSNRFDDLMEPKSFWKLADYMQAIEFALETNCGPSDKENYETEVRQSIVKVKKAVLNLERFLETK
ncbi:hypothetical protein [Paenibacillus sp. JDR-2]|uniref:hypothetical protein n=1 Tax=Paenibacillus sp. (strain JDR-2) TaxID=324057 RepID=UPI000166A5FD|nr:hypothetical protein [Paenibacillus sp. JDR-2]ACT00245.1 hypothetical protein Pjdr2_1575 [Paenibacillus sp. JDR-2]